MWTQIEIDNRQYLLHPDQDVEEVKSAIATAATSAPAFVSLSGIEQTISVLVQPTTHVVVLHGDREHRELLDYEPEESYNDWEL